MRKIMLVLFILSVCFLVSCDNGDKKMKGLTYEELGEYMSSLDGLTEIGDSVEVWEEGEYLLQEDGTLLYEEGLHYVLGDSICIPCGDDKLKIEFSPQAFNNADFNQYIAIDMSDILDVEILFNGAWRSGLYNSPKIPQCNPSYYPISEIISRSGFKYRSENNIAYIIRYIGFKSSPSWKEWLDYEIPWHLLGYDHKASHGFFNLYWYNPKSEEFERGLCYRELADSTEIYVVYQNISLFSSPRYTLDREDRFPERYTAPLLMSETKYNELKSEYPSFRFDHYKKGTVKEFSDWFMGEYQKEIPAAFADIKDEYVYYPAYGNGVHPDDLNGNEYDCDEMFIPDMKNLCVDFDELRSYVIKITIPHDGAFSDIYWELIG